MRIYYMDEKENRLLDFQTLQDVLKMNKSKLYRAICELQDVKVVKYKNQYLYPEKTLFMLMREILIERIEQEKYGFEKN
jgi:hypothetical protein